MSDRSSLFDGVAARYDRARPSYPDALIDDVIARAAVPPSGRILEIGSGTGKATLAFARRGYRIVCLEPGPRLAALAASHFASDPKVRIEISRFEDWDGVDPTFDLVIAAQAFHWLEPRVRMEKTARCLRSGGWVAILWNTPVAGELPVDRDLKRVYLEHAPGLVSDAGSTSTTVAGQLHHEFGASKLFGPLVVREFGWSARYSAQEYSELVATHSDHLALPDAQLEALQEALLLAIRDHGDQLPVRYSTRLFMAQRNRA